MLCMIPPFGFRRLCAEAFSSSTCTCAPLVPPLIGEFSVQLAKKASGERCESRIGRSYLRTTLATVRNKQRPNSIGGGEQHLLSALRENRRPGTKCRELCRAFDWWVHDPTTCV